MQSQPYKGMEKEKSVQITAAPLSERNQSSKQKTSLALYNSNSSIALYCIAYFVLDRCKGEKSHTISDSAATIKDS